MSKSPFPGMDPYLEQCWRDVHQKLCVYGCDDVQSQLGGGMHARVEERPVVELPEEAERSIYPDVRVVERRQRTSDAAIRPAEGVMLAEPVVVEVADETFEEGFIQIIDSRNGGRVITVIEFMSPSNKFTGPTRQQYLQKRDELWQAGVSFVEINLLRAGEPARGYRRGSCRRICERRIKRSYTAPGGEPKWSTTRSSCATACRRSPSHYGKPTHRSRWTFSR
jgi:hypothetical protein